MFTGHHTVSPSIGFSRDHGNLWYRGLRIGINEFGTISNDPTEFLGSPWEESRNVLKGDDGNVEGIQESDKAGPFYGGVNIKTPGKPVGLVGNDPHRHSVEPRESDDDISGEVLMDLEETMVIHNAVDDCYDVVGLSGVVRDNPFEGIISSLRVILAVNGWRPFPVVLGEVAEELLYHVDRVLVILPREMGDPTFGVVSDRPPQLFIGDLLMGYGLDHLGPRDEHVAAFLAHEDEVGQGRGIDGASSTRAEDDRNLGNNPRS